MEDLQRLTEDLFNWYSYSSLQKLIITSVISVVLALLSSLWTLPCFVCIAVFAGYKLSEQILHHEKASIVAEQILDKLESLYLQVFTVVRDLNHKLFLITQPSEKQEISQKSVDDNDNDGAILSESLHGSLKVSSPSSLLNVSVDVSQELNSIQLLILRDFIRSWYADYSYDPQFLKETKLLLQQTFNNLVSRIAKQEAKCLIKQLTQLYTVHLANFQKAKNSFHSHKIHPNTKVKASLGIRRLSSVDEAYENALPLHSALESEQAEIEYLKGVVSMLVVCTINNHVIKGVCARTLLVDILTNNIFFPLMHMMSEPEWLMSMVIKIASYEEGEATAVEGPQDKSVQSSTGEVGDKLTTDTNSSEAARDEIEVKGIEEDHDSPKSSETSDLTTCESNPAESSMQEERCVEGQSKDIFEETSAISQKCDNTSSELDEDCSGKKSTNSSQSKDEAESETYPIDENNLKQLDNHVSKDLKCDGLVDAEEDKTDKMCHSISDDVFEDENTAVNGYDNMELDPQKIISFSSSKFQESDEVSVDSDNSSESLTSSFPKLTSLKHFFVDSLKSSSSKQQQQKPEIKKPKSLSLISGITSNLKPLSSRSTKSTTSESEQTSSSNMLTNPTPQLLLDGVPVGAQNVESGPDQSHISPAPSKTAEVAVAANQDPELTPAASEQSDITPSPGFFSNLFSFSSTQGPSPQSGADVASLFSLSTPSPTPNANITDSWDDVVKSSMLDDRRIFQDISIQETTTCNEFRSTAQYTLYTICYEALYFSDEGKSIMRSGTVRRRYREFTNLQSRLEDQAAYKSFMKKVKGPKRWPTLPFKSTDKDTVEGRRLFLEKYLKDLIEVEAICNGPDIREFLAYEGDSHIAFVKKSPELTVPRIDKMLLRGVTGVVDRIKAIPNNAQEVISGLRRHDVPDERPGAKSPGVTQDTDMFEINTHHGHSQGNTNMLLESCRSTMDDSYSDPQEDLLNITDAISDQKTCDKMEEVYKQEVQKILANLPRPQGDGAERPDDEESDTSKLPEQESLSFAVLDLLVQGLQSTDHWLRRDRVMQSLQAVLAKALNRYLESSIDELVLPEELAFYLRTLRETVWPQGQLWTDESATATTTTTGSVGQDGPSDKDQVETEESDIKAKAGRALATMFPESVKLVVGKSEFDKVIKLYLDCLQSEKLNRHLLYQILDQLMEELFPEVATYDLIHNLIFSPGSPTLTLPRLVKEAEKL